jgi:hypothetical protein
MTLDANDRKKLARMQMLMPMVPFPLLVRKLKKDKAKRFGAVAEGSLAPGKLKEIAIGALLGYALSKILH